MTLVQKLAEVMAAVERIPKRGRNAFHNYDYATEADIVAIVRQELAKRHVMLIPAVTGERREPVGEKGSVLTILTMDMTFMDGESNEVITRPWVGCGSDKDDKGIYKAMTGGEKYFLLKTFLMPTGDDPERDDKDQLKERDKATAKPDKATRKARGPLPEGAVYIEKAVPKQSGKREWVEVVLSTGESIIAHELGAMELAINLAQDASPVVVTTRRNGKGNIELDSIRRWTPDTVVPPNGTPPADPPLTAKDIAF